MRVRPLIGRERLIARDSYKLTHTLARHAGGMRDQDISGLRRLSKDVRSVAQTPEIHVK